MEPIARHSAEWRPHPGSASDADCRGRRPDAVGAWRAASTYEAEGPLERINRHALGGVVGIEDKGVNLQPRVGADNQASIVDEAYLSQAFGAGDDFVAHKDSPLQLHQSSSAGARRVYSGIYCNGVTTRIDRKC